MKRLKISPLFLDIKEGIKSRPGRFGLSLFAMSIGMAVLTALIALLAGLEVRSQQLSEEFGANVIAILPKPSNDKPLLKPVHADLLRANYPGAQVSAVRLSQTQTPGADRNLVVIATESELVNIRQWSIVNGRFFDRQDMQARKRYAVVTEALRKNWQWDVGATILLKHTPFLIVGVVASDDSALAGEYGDSRLATGEYAVFVPLTVEPSWDDQVVSEASIDALYMRPANNMAAEAVLPGLQNLLSQPGMGLQNLSWIIPATLIENITRMQTTIGLSVGVIAILCLILGGTTLTSLLVANVRDRISEIGLRRALGATEMDIASLFIAEGCVATVAAGILGPLFVLLILTLKIDILSRLPLDIGAHTVFLPLIFSVFLGVLFSFWPAASAARISPAEALRSE